MTAERDNQAGCPKCGGGGWIVVETEDGREVARRCDCSRAGLLDRLGERACVPRRYQTLTLDNFDPYLPVLKSALEKAEEFIGRYPAVDHGLLFAGPPGTGKTHLATAVLVAAIRKCKMRGLFCDYRELIRSIQDSYNPSTVATEMSIIKPVLEADLLVLDELGALRPTEWVRDTITYIINNRYSNDKITIFTSNFRLETRDLEKVRLEQENKLLEMLKKIEDLRDTLSPDEYRVAKPAMLKDHDLSVRWEQALQDRIGARLMSRLYEMCRFVPLDGVPDYRKRSQKGY